MGIWYWLVIICGLLLVLVLLRVMQARRYAGTWAPRDPVYLPSSVADDVFKTRRLENGKHRSQRVIVRLIQLYEHILGRLQPDENPSFCGCILSDLGNAYFDLPIGERVANITRAIEQYQEALRLLTPEATPFAYASTLNNLGIAYRALPLQQYTEVLSQGNVDMKQRIETIMGSVSPNTAVENHADKLMQAIRCYEEAARVWPETACYDYAATQNNLGNAYRDLLTGDRNANLEKAIACYEEALRIWTPENFPFEYARAMNNLGTVYSDLPTGDHKANLKKAIACYKEALRFRTPITTPQEYANTQYNLKLDREQLWRLDQIRE